MKCKQPLPQKIIIQLVRGLRRHQCRALKQCVEIQLMELSISQFSLYISFINFKNIIRKTDKKRMNESINERSIILILNESKYIYDYDG